MWSDSPPTVLVVDDELSNRCSPNASWPQADTRWLQDEAAQGLRAIEAHGWFSLYLLDIMLPGVRGTQLAREIRTLYPSAKILYFTAFSHTLFPTSDRLLRDDQAFLQKPVSNRELLEAVSLLLFGHIKGPQA